MTAVKFDMLHIDLTTGKKEVVDATEMVEKYIGGRGLGAKLLWDRVPQGTDPLSPENILYLGVGPMTGFFGSCVCFSAKSPLTMLAGRSLLNGHLGREIIYAGYNAGILLTGKASKPVYIYIRNDQVEIRDATQLWGKLNLETQCALMDEVKQETDDQNFMIASIGPAGEHLVRNASICHGFFHFAGRLGMGAVMGSKNVKAIVVRGTKSPQYMSPVKVFDILSTFIKESYSFKARERRWGHYTSMPARYYAGSEGIKNKQLGWDPICDLSNPLLFEQDYKLWNYSCDSCPAGCKVPYMRRMPPLGPCAGELRHDNAGGWNANVMVPGFEAQLYLTPFIDNLGLDGEDVSGVIAWMMECYEKGIVTIDDLDGIDLKWGDLKAICQLVTKIAYREGIGNVLAEGLKFAPLKIGRGSEKYAITHKGVAITSYELRGNMNEALEMAVSPVGELHAGKGSLPERVVLDSLTICHFMIPTIRNIFGGSGYLAINMLKAACGWNFDIQEWDKISKRIAILERCYCMREGYIPERDDLIPSRFFNETIYTKYGKPLKLDRDEFLKQREKWYSSIRLDKNGIPSSEYLQELGLEFVIPVLEKLELNKDK
jgi:aldehyde:ferredoxin oxidoreductase